MTLVLLHIHSYIYIIILEFKSIRMFVTRHNLIIIIYVLFVIMK